MTDDSSPIPSDGASEPTGEADNLFAVALPKNDDAFPVLRAFQTFIDQERERSRRRITMLSTAFIVALVVLMLAFVGFFALFFTHVMSHDEAQQARLFELVSRGPAPQPAPAAAPAPASTPAPTPAVPSVPSVPSVPVAPSPSPSLRTISVRPVKALVVPEGYEADQIRVQTQSGASIPLRTLLPVPRAGR